MTPAARAWREQQAMWWTHRAADLRAAGEAARASGLESVVRRLRIELDAADRADRLDRAPVAHPPIETLPPIGPVSRVTPWQGGFAAADMVPPISDWLRLEIRRHVELIERYRLHEDSEFYSCQTIVEAAELRLRDLRARCDRLSVALHPSPPPAPVPFKAGPQIEMFA